jgi:hypothetical protein
MRAVSVDRRTVWRLLPLTLVGLAVSILWLTGHPDGGIPEHRAALFYDLVESIEPQPDISHVRDDQQIMYYGIHVDKVYELSLQSRTFSADGYIWVEWASDTQRLMEDKRITPDRLIRLVNQIESWDSTFEPITDEPVSLSAGRYYQRYRFSSRFYDDEINFRRDPFDSLILPIVAEIAPDEMSNKYQQTLLYPHHHQNGFLGLSGDLSGYQLHSAVLNTYLHTYPSRFGSWYQPVQSQARLDIVYRSDYWSAFVNWVLPLIIVMSVVLLSPAVAGSLGDVRLAIPSTALLTLIFLQQAYHDDRPSLPYLTFLDQLFACSYLIAMGLFALFTWGTNVYTKAADDEKEAAMRRIDKVDFVFQCVSVAGFSVVVLMTWLST